ncbi:MAG: HNH endonuclease [Cyclobacteriaceae bacterium]|nr:HNH endonuclease [Cyclobacteriaceae bacterium]
MNELQVMAFWSKVDIKTKPRDCWNWRGAKKLKGYGNVRINKRVYSAHRVAYELTTGRLLPGGKIPKGFLVCHLCDNPSCCNPNHLVLGTIKSNSADMLIKNRQKKPETAARGIHNGMSKLTDNDVTEIRRSYANGEYYQYELAGLYGVSQPTIGAIVLNKTWRHV